MDKYQQDFIRNLKYYRSIRGLSQSELAEKSDVATGTIGNIECGLAKPSFDLMLLIAHVLKITPADFFTSAGSALGHDSEPASNERIIAEYRLLREFCEKLKVHFEE